MDGRIPTYTLRNGDAFPAIGMGTFGSDKYGAGAVADAVADGVRRGFRLIDCASVYGNEAQIGAALARAYAEGAAARGDLFLMSKLWNDMHGDGDVLVSLAKTLKDLRTDCLDAYFVHWPYPNYHAPGCDGDARNPDSRPFSAEGFMRVWRQMERAWKLGLVRHLGMSNMTVSKLEAVLPQCAVAPSLLEAELHPSFQQRELCETARRHGIHVIGYCPLGSPSRPARDTAPEDVADMDLPEVRAVAEARGVSPAAVCLMWAARRGHTPIPFSVKPDQIRSNLDAIRQNALTPDDMALLENAERNCRLVKGQVFLWPGAKDWRDLWE